MEQPQSQPTGVVRASKRSSWGGFLSPTDLNMGHVLSLARLSISTVKHAKFAPIAILAILALACRTSGQTNSESEFRSYSVDRAAEKEICSRACKKASSCSLLLGKSAKPPRIRSYSNLECTNNCSSSSPPLLAAAYTDSPPMPILGDCLKLNECSAFWACASQSFAGPQLVLAPAHSTECESKCGRLHNCLDTTCDSDSVDCDDEARLGSSDAKIREELCMQQCKIQKNSFEQTDISTSDSPSRFDCMSLPSCEPFLDCVEAELGESNDLPNSPQSSNSQIPGVAQVCVDICQRVETCAPKNGIIQGYSIADPVDASTEEWIECAVQCQLDIQPDIQQDIQLGMQKARSSQPSTDDESRKNESRRNKMIKCLQTEDCSDFQHCVEKL